MMVLQHQETQSRTYDSNEKGWYFRFHDNNAMSYEYIISIT